MKKYILLLILFLPLCAYADTPQYGGGSGTGDILAAGTVPMTADWPFGAFSITGGVNSTWSGTGTFGTVSAGAGGFTVGAGGAATAASLALTADLPLTEGGTGASTAAAARTALEVTTAASGTHTGSTTIVNLIVSGSLDIPGTIDFGGAESLEIPNLADPTVNAAGEIALDTTDDQLTYYGAAQRTIRYEEEVCVTLENLAAADDDYAFMSFRDAVTITGVWCHYRGTGTTAATIDLEDGAGNAMTHTDATCGVSTAAATPQAVTAANTLTAYEMLAFNVTNAVNPETDTYTICVSYTVTEQ